MTWPIVTLGDLAEIQLGKMLSPGARSGRSPEPYLRNTNVQWGRIELDDLLRMDFDEDERAKFSLRRGDLLVCEGGEPGRCAVLQDDLPGVFFQKALMRVRPQNERLDMRFLQRFMQYAASQGLFAKDGNQSTIAHFPAVRLKALEFPLPPVSEQRRIADLLCKADAIRRKRKETIALTDKLLRSTFLDMFGDPVSNTKHWDAAAIGDLCEQGASLVDGPFGSSLKPESYVSAGVRVIRNWNINDDHFDEGQFKYITREKFEEIQRSEVCSGDVLITTKGTVGDVCMMPSLPGPSVLSASGTVRLRLPPDNRLLGPVVVCQMILPSYKEYLHSFEAGSAQQYLNLSGIKKMRLILPPLDLQRRFVDFRARVRAVKDRLLTATAETELLFKSSTHRAFCTSDRNTKSHLRASPASRT